MHIKALMRSPVPRIEEDTPLDHVRGILRRERLGAVPVMRGALAVGLITDRELRLAEPSCLPAAAPHEFRPAWPLVRAREVMVKGVVTVSAKATVAEAARQLSRARAQALFVTVDRDIVGTVTRTDLLTALLGAIEQRPRTRFGRVLAVSADVAAGAAARAAASPAATGHVRVLCWTGGRAPAQAGGGEGDPAPV
jgi:acetoin utilization protein AcuB